MAHVHPEPWEDPKNGSTLRLDYLRHRVLGSRIRGSISWILPGLWARLSTNFGRSFDLRRGDLFNRDAGKVLDYTIPILYQVLYHSSLFSMPYAIPILSDTSTCYWLRTL